MESEERMKKGRKTGKLWLEAFIAGSMDHGRKERWININNHFNYLRVNLLRFMTNNILLIGETAQSMA